MINFKCFTTDTCPNCPRMKEELAKYPQIELINCSTPEGMEQAKKYSVNSVPMIMVLNNDDILASDNRPEKVKIFIQTFKNDNK